MNYQPMYDLALLLARQAGEQIANMRSDLELDFKYDGSELVTQADVAADKLINAGIKAAYPDHDLLSEELGPNNPTDCEHLWIIDPIDGTVNYAHDHDQSAVCIAYYHQGLARAAIVHNPFTQETFAAMRGEGATLNGRPIHCAQKTELKRALVGTGFPYAKDTINKIIARVSAVLPHCADIRRLGSAALDMCWVACGRLDIYYENVKPWDMAAAQLIAREAGATVGHIHPLEEGDNPELTSANLLVASPAFFEPVQQLLRTADNNS
jgi:myo-inositol-1(or 4)-monophosphatase